MQWLDRFQLRRAALRYAAHGWAVTPGACLTGQRFHCGRAGCPIKGCHPAIESWEDTATTDPSRVDTWWRHRPHTVLLATGGAFDALEVPAAVGLRMLGAVRLHAHMLGAGGPSPAGSSSAGRSSAGLGPLVDGLAGSRRGDARGPVAVTPDGRWIFLVRPGAALRPELTTCLDVLLHGRGSWIPAAPSRTPEGPVRWAVAPEQNAWRLPESGIVQAMVLDALEALGRRPVRPVTLSVPRQMSTGRRAA
ncbi:bifunctional DNA primase/polymerase [Symbioplanes lichenis]|uniref:bifunctional DNA primase/polymerase n=1 Tax=Symbioplanes lichenis TaxID=1629072 RepID=UPI00273A260D|nr:bifunctional DNA primase/polymerase [Actinoplanes lichenis]